MGADVQEKPANGFQARPPVGEEDNRVVGAKRLHRDASNGTASDAGEPPQAVGGPTGVSERWRLVADPDERLRFETLVSDLSARFINLPADDVDKEIEAALGRLVQFLGLDRSTLFQLSEDETTLLVSHCWVAPGFESVKGLIPRDVVPWALRKVLQGETILFSSVEELPEEAAQDKASLRKIGPRSNVTFPLTAGGGAVFGALAFGQITRERGWPENLVQRLRLVAQILANALLRRRSEEKLRQALSEIKQLKEQLHQENVYLPQGGQRAARPGASHRAQPGRQANPRAGGSGGAHRRHRAAVRRNRHGQGADGHGDPQPEQAPRPDDGEGQLRGPAGDAGGERAVRPGEGRLHRGLSKQIGRFELAHNSTIFLDEVGELPPEVQVKLLRVLQEGQLEHLGSPRPIQVNVRVIAATNRDLGRLVREGRFREDLYYRLNVFPITVPPLRERRQDIPLMVWAFVEEFSKALGKTVRAVAKESMDALQSYAWPGNVRELRNVVERAMIVSTGPTLRVAVPAAADSTAARSMAMEDVEREHILHALELTQWRVRGEEGAAALLRLNPTTLESRMAKLGIRRPGKSPAFRASSD